MPKSKTLPKFSSKQKQETDIQSSFQTFLDEFESQKDDSMVQFIKKDQKSSQSNHQEKKNENNSEKSAFSIYSINQLYQKIVQFKASLGKIVDGNINTELKCFCGKRCETKQKLYYHMCYHHKMRKGTFEYSFYRQQLCRNNIKYPQSQNNLLIRLVLNNNYLQVRLPDQLIMLVKIQSLNQFMKTVTRCKKFISLNGLQNRRNNQGIGQNLINEIKETAINHIKYSHRNVEITLKNLCIKEILSIFILNIYYFVKDHKKCQQDLLIIQYLQSQNQQINQWINNNYAKVFSKLNIKIYNCYININNLLFTFLLSQNQV